MGAGVLSREKGDPLGTRPRVIHGSHPRGPRVGNPYIPWHVGDFLPGFLWSCHPLE